MRAVKWRNAEGSVHDGCKGKSQTPDALITLTLKSTQELSDDPAGMVSVFKNFLFKYKIHTEKCTKW